MKCILCSLLVATLPFGSVLADAPKETNAKVTLVYQAPLRPAGRRPLRSEALRGCPWLRSKACRPVDQCLPSGGDFEDAKGCFERQTGSPDFSK